MAYRLFLRPAAERNLRGLPRAILTRVERAIEKLLEEPRPAGCRKLSGFENEWRVRVGGYRILYIIDDAQREVRIARIAHRREVYR
ncbi:MAG: type II toxin-antitoxin system RelE/ParE family toxin [Deltaproteobacteria bacterium]|nr:type II toxin-antitoxin system RelE/ParE family toxin [Deltaproteobacteria bacterium]